MLEKKLKKTRKAVDDLHAAQAAVPPVPFEAS